MSSPESQSLTTEEQVLILQAVLEATRAKLAQAVFASTELEGLLTLERQKSSRLSDILSGKVADQ